MQEMEIFSKVIEYLILSIVGGLISIGIWVVKTQLQTTKTLEKLNLKVDHNQLLEEQHNEKLQMQIQENTRRIDRGEEVINNIDARVSDLERNINE